MPATQLRLTWKNSTTGRVRMNSGVQWGRYRNQACSLTLSLVVKVTS